MKTLTLPDIPSTLIIATDGDDQVADQRFLHAPARWANRYCPWVGLEGGDGLVLNIAGSSHLFGGEPAMLADMQSRLSHARLEARIAIADTRGAAWAMAHYGAGGRD